jgi:hypothetical protein
MADEVVARLAAVLRFASLEDVLHWGHAQRPPCDVIDVIVQDEYTHDVLVRGPGAAYLCFDTT